MAEQKTEVIAIYAANISIGQLTPDSYTMDFRHRDTGDILTQVMIDRGQAEQLISELSEKMR